MSLQSRIARELLISTQYVSVITRSASKRYYEYAVRKRSGRGYRTIFHPSRELKALQRWLLFNVIESWPVHSAAQAYRPDASVRKNASLHANNAFLLKLDFDTFFPSISRDDVAAYLERGPAARLRWNHRDIWTFTSLVCHRNQLTIGAPTSPALSNALCYELDVRVSAWASALGITYSRYADDITLSCNQRNVLRDAPDFVAAVLPTLYVPRRLRLNDTKTRHLSRKNRVVITGLIVTPQGHLSIGRAKKREIRSKIHSYASLDVAEKRSLAGLLAHAIHVEPDLLNRLIIKFGYDAVKTARTPPAQQ